MMLGLGGKKTEAIAFIPPRRISTHPLLPRLTVKGVEIAWVSEYRYLGYSVRADMRDDGALAAMAGKLAGQWQRYFNTTATILRHSPAFALQVFKTTVSGATNYLLAFANPNRGAADKLDKVSLRAARKALRLSDRVGDLACNDIVWGESRLPRGAAILARERTRFMLKMRTSPFATSDIAPRIFHALSVTAAADALPMAHTAKSITHRLLQLERFGAADGTSPAVLLRETDFKDCAKSAAIVSRRVSLATWQSEARAELAKRPLPPSPNVLRPPSSERGVAAYLNDFYRSTLDDVGSNKYTTVLATRGPGCCGGILSQVSRMSGLATKLRALAAVRRGRKGMFDAPLAVPGRSFTEQLGLASEEADDGGAGALESNKVRAARVGAERRQEFSQMSPCCLCGCNVEDPYHVLVECPDVATVAARYEFTRGAPQRLATLARLMLLPRHVVDRLSFKGHLAEISSRERQIATIAQLARATDWSSEDGKFALFHLFAVATWTSRPCSAGMPLSSALAALFESVELKNHHVRPLANSWANWGSSGVLTVFDAWNSSAAPKVASAIACSQPVRAARRAAAVQAASRSPRRGQRSRPLRPRGSSLPSRFDGFVVDLTV